MTEETYIIYITCHSIHWCINPPSKAPPPVFCQAHLKSENCPNPFLGNPHYILVSREPVLKI